MYRTCCRQNSQPDVNAIFLSNVFFFNVSFSHLQGFPVPNAAVSVLMEVMTTQMLTPRASFTGHACGALAGLMYVLFYRVLAEGGLGSLFRRYQERYRRPVRRGFGGGAVGHAHHE